jgi:HSP20 family molecular chaperone IbpA
MADEVRRPRRLRDLVEDSRNWAVSDLIRNLDEEMERVEMGFTHMIWGIDDRPVTRILKPLPIAPRFKTSESEDELSLEVEMPNVPEDNMQVSVDRNKVEVFGCTEEAQCRPYYLGVESREVLDPDSLKMRLVGYSLEIKVKKRRKKRIIAR